jgi:hypothetical protein
MGLLDDAIREHLDLKRRRGADPSEVERDEREALGPVRRNQAPAATEVEDELDPDRGFAYDQAEENDWAFDGDEDDASVPAPRAGPAAPAEPARIEDDLDLEPEPFSDDPEPFAEDPRPAAEEDLGGATVEYDVAGDLQRDLQRESAPEPAPEPGKSGDEDEDVLEETPEFLQDTPEHDRLWFEQRPPRDFDFDG